MRSIIIELGRCGWGRDAGPPPSIKLGWVRLFRLPGSVIAEMKAYRVALAAAAEKLRRRGQ